MKFKTTGLILLFLALPVLAQQLPLEMVVANRFANIRKGPGTGYELVATLYKGDRLFAERKFRNWLRVTIPDGRIGWIREDLVEPFDPDKVPLTDVQADSLKELIAKRSALITTMEDSSKNVLAGIRKQEQLRDSLLARTNLTEIPRLQAQASQDTVQVITPPPKALGTQKSVQTQEEPFSSRFEFSPRLGALIQNGSVSPLAGFSVNRNFTRELAYQGSVSFSRLDPPQKGEMIDYFQRTIVTGELVYSYKPGDLTVPFVELGAGLMRTEADDSAYNAFELSFGVGSRLFWTPDIAFRFGYRGHAVFGNDHELIQVVYLGASVNLPLFEDRFPYDYNNGFYLVPYLGYHIFSQRFAVDDAKVVGMRLGRRINSLLAGEVAAGYLSLTIMDGFTGTVEDAAEIRFQALCYPWRQFTGPYLMSGAGLLLFGGKGRGLDSTSYGFFLYGGGFNLQLTPGFSVRSEMAHFLYPKVSSAYKAGDIATAGALQLSVGLNFSF